VLLLKRTLIAARPPYSFGKSFVMGSIKVKRCKVDVCLFHQWISIALLECMSWVDASRKKHFTLDKQGEFVEYIGCRIERSLKDRWMKLTQPIWIRSFSE
jgi:hypothetical protein